MQLAKTRRGARAAPRGRRAVHQRPDRPDDRRRVRLVRGPRRRQPRRAERADRLRRRARLGRHDRPGAAAGLPARRVPVRARLRRPGRAPRGAPRRDRACCSATSSRPSARARTTSPSRSRCRLPAAVVPVEARRAGHAERAGADERRRAPRRRGRQCATACAGDAAARPVAGPGHGRHRQSRWRRSPTVATRSPAMVDRLLGRGREPVPTPLLRSPSPTIQGRPCGPGSSWRATSAGRGRSSSSARWPTTSSSSTATGCSATTRRSSPGSPDRRPAGRRHRPAEGRRHRREHPPQLRHAAPRGLPQGDAGDGAGRALRPAGRDVRRRAGRPSRRRSPRSAASPRRSPARSA